MATYHDLARRLVELGMLTDGSTTAALGEIGQWAGLDDAIPAEELGSTLAELGAALAVHTDDVGIPLDEAYDDVLTRAAALTAGAVTIADVALVPDDTGGYEGLTFTRNGEPMAWHVDHEDPDDEYLDGMAIWEQLGDLAPGTEDDQRTFHQLKPDETRMDDTYYVLATKAQLDALSTEFGLEFDPAG